MGLYVDNDDLLDAVTFPDKGLEFLSWVVGNNYIIHKWRLELALNYYFPHSSDTYCTKVHNLF